MYDLTRIKNEVNEACRQFNVTIPEGVEIKINSRLTRTLGRVQFVGKKLLSIEFSKQLIDTCTDESIRDVILHESAHAIALLRTGENHGHDDYFKNICHKLGTTADQTTTKIERVINFHSRFEIVCPHCGVIAEYSKKCKAITNVKDYYCKDCGNDKLTVKTNW